MKVWLFQEIEDDISKTLEYLDDKRIRVDWEEINKEIEVWIGNYNSIIDEIDRDRIPNPPPGKTRREYQFERRRERHSCLCNIAFLRHYKTSILPNQTSSEGLSKKKMILDQNHDDHEINLQFKDYFLEGYESIAPVIIDKFRHRKKREYAVLSLALDKMNIIMIGDNRSSFHRALKKVFPNCGTRQNLSKYFSSRDSELSVEVKRMISEITQILRSK